MRSDGGLAYLTSDEMGETDRVAIEEYGIDVLALMENAGRAVALVALRMLGGKAVGEGVCCLVGKGNNGGDGLVAARHLSNWGASVRVIVAGERSGLKDVPNMQAGIIEKMGIPFLGPNDGFEECSLIVDALLGYGARGNPRDPVAALIRRANASKRSILAVDVPSGLDATTGAPGDPCIAAKATVTLGFPKSGFLNIESRPLVGELYLADISFPSKLYSTYSVRKDLFEKESVIRIG